MHVFEERIVAIVMSVPGLQFRFVSVYFGR